jgi:hypothetical protein
MKTVLFIGDHPRHLHIARQVATTGTLVGVVVETREAHSPAPPDGLRASTRALFIEHFRRREVAEHRFFGAPGPSDFDACAPRVLRVTMDTLNGAGVATFLRDLGPDLILSYGVHKLSPEVIALASRAAWNIHGGLSPWYRGTATHF